MGDSAPAPLTTAERVALTVAVETLRQTALNLRKDWDLFAVTHPDRATPDVHKGFLMAVHRIGHAIANIERNTNAEDLRS
jgi:hypothetical protein